jgi:leucyl aminopeptidase
MCALLGALDASHIPLECREAKGTKNLLKIERLGFFHESLDVAEAIIKQVNAIELGRIVTRDIGGSDPERMTAENVLKYIEQTLGSTEIKVI